jgi:hypothetical protein
LAVPLAQSEVQSFLNIKVPEPQLVRLWAPQVVILLEETRIKKMADKARNEVSNL